MEIKKAESQNDVKIIASLAEKIWRQHFTPIIGAPQVEYMLNAFQSEKAVTEQIQKSGYTYYIAFSGGIPAGYCAVAPQQDGTLFLSKLYIDINHRGKGVAKLLTGNFIKEFKKGEGLKVWLTVNKNNTDSIAAYKKIGFKIEGSVVTDIGGGFVMDDYKMSGIF